MSSSSSFIGYVYQASPIVKVVLAILIIASVFSWTYILQKYKYLKQVKSLLAKFEKEVWLVSDLGQFYQKTQKRSNHRQLIFAIYYNIESLFGVSCWGH